MNINDVLKGNHNITSVDEQKEVINQMKERKVFDLEESERLNLIDFLCEKVDLDTSIDYLFHVLDTEISYPIDDNKVKTLFSDERMKKIKDSMLEKLEETAESSSEDEDDKDDEDDVGDE